MRQAVWMLAAMLLSGCVEQDVLRRPDPIPGVEISTVEAAPGCRAIQAVEVRAGHHDPTTHELLGVLAAEHGANYVVLDASAVVANNEDIFAVALARLFRCPIALVCYRCSAVQQRAGETHRVAARPVPIEPPVRPIVEVQQVDEAEPRSSEGE